MWNPKPCPAISFFAFSGARPLSAQRTDDEDFKRFGSQTRWEPAHCKYAALKITFPGSMEVRGPPSGDEIKKLEETLSKTKYSIYSFRRTLATAIDEQVRAMDTPITGKAKSYIAKHFGWAKYDEMLKRYSKREKKKEAKTKSAKRAKNSKDDAKAQIPYIFECNAATIIREALKK